MADVQGEKPLELDITGLKQTEHNPSDRREDQGRRRNRNDGPVGASSILEQGRDGRRPTEYRRSA